MRVQSFSEGSVHLLQIWILPERKGLKPSYEQLTFADADLRGRFALVAGPNAPVTISQDANLYIARLDKGAIAKQSIGAGRHAWLQVARGSIVLNGLRDGQAGDVYNSKAGVTARRCPNESRSARGSEGSI